MHEAGAVRIAAEIPNIVHAKRLQSASVFAIIIVGGVSNGKNIQCICPR